MPVEVRPRARAIKAAANLVYVGLVFFIAGTYVWRCIASWRGGERPGLSLSFSAVTWAICALMAVFPLAVWSVLSLGQRLIARIGSKLLGRGHTESDASRLPLFALLISIGVPPGEREEIQGAWSDLSLELESRHGAQFAGWVLLVCCLRDLMYFRRWRIAIVAVALSVAEFLVRLLQR